MLANFWKNIKTISWYWVLAITQISCQIKNLINSILSNNILDNNLMKIMKKNNMNLANKLKQKASVFDDVNTSTKINIRQVRKSQFIETMKIVDSKYKIFKKNIKNLLQKIIFLIKHWKDVKNYLKYKIIIIYTYIKNNIKFVHTFIKNLNTTQITNYICSIISYILETNSFKIIERNVIWLLAKIPTEFVTKFRVFDPDIKTRLVKSRMSSQFKIKNFCVSSKTNQKAQLNKEGLVTLSWHYVELNPFKAEGIRKRRSSSSLVSSKPNSFKSERRFSSSSFDENKEKPNTLIDPSKVTHINKKYASFSKEIQIALQQKVFTQEDMEKLNPQTLEEIHALTFKLGHTDEKGNPIIIQREIKEKTLQEVLDQPRYVIPLFVAKVSFIFWAFYILVSIAIGRIVVESCWVTQHPFLCILAIVIAIPSIIFILLLIKVMYIQITDRISWWPKVVRKLKKKIWWHPLIQAIRMIGPKFYFVLFAIFIAQYIYFGEDFVFYSKDFFYMHRYVEDIDRKSVVNGILYNFVKLYPQFTVQFNEYVASYMDTLKVPFDHGNDVGRSFVNNEFTTYKDQLLVAAEFKQIELKRQAAEVARLAAEAAEKALQKRLAFYESTRVVSAETCFVVVLIIAILSMN